MKVTHRSRGLQSAWNEKEEEEEKQSSPVSHTILHDTIFEKQNANETIDGKT